MKKVYVTITGMKYYYGFNPFSIGKACTITYFQSGFVDLYIHECFLESDGGVVLFIIHGVG